MTEEKLIKEAMKKLAARSLKSRFGGMTAEQKSAHMSAVRKGAVDSGVKKVAKSRVKRGITRA